MPALRGVNAKTKWLLPLSLRLITVPDRPLKIRQYWLHQETPLIYIERIATSNTPRTSQTSPLWKFDPVPDYPFRPSDAPPRRNDDAAIPFQAPCKSVTGTLYFQSGHGGLGAKTRSKAKNLSKSCLIWGRRRREFSSSKLRVKSAPKPLISYYFPPFPISNLIFQISEAVGRKIRAVCGGFPRSSTRWIAEMEYRAFSPGSYPAASERRPPAENSRLLLFLRPIRRV